MENGARSLRNTQQRRLVSELVCSGLNHPTADEVYEAARRSDPNISKGTVYRNLNLLSELGEIRRLSMPVGPDHYDFNTENHYHFICRKCYKVVDNMIPYNNAFDGFSESLPGFKTEFHRLVLVGLCPECRKREEKSNF